MDWLNKERVDRFTFEMIDTFNLESSRGMLENVSTEGTSLTHGIDTSTKVSGSLIAVNHNYLDNSLIRIHHYVDEERFHEEMGTFFVSSRDVSENQASEETFSLVSMFGRISDDVFENNYTISSGRTAQDVLKDIFKRYSVTCSVAAGANNKTYSSPLVYEVGSNVLCTVYDIANDAGLQLSVNGHGVIVISKYTAPKLRSSVFEFSDKNGTIIGEITKRNNPFGAVNRVVVSSTQDEQEVIGYKDVATSSKVAYTKLGRRNTAYEQTYDLTPFTTAGATARATTLLNNYEEDPTEYSFKGMYLGLSIGDVVDLNLKNIIKKVVIRNMEIDFSPGLICQYTCKEV